MKKNKTKKTTKKRTTLGVRQLRALGTEIAREHVIEVMRTVAAQGISLPLEYANIMEIQLQAARELEKRQHLQWDNLSWDHQDAFLEEGWAPVMREHKIIR